MAVWNGTVTTQLGLNLIAKVIAGKTNLAFTKLQTSEGNYTSSNLVGMTSLLNVKQEFNVSNVSVQNATTVLVKGVITNTGLSNQYNLNAIGLFATDPDLGEILFSVTTADTADIIPAKTNTNTTSLIVNILTSVTDSSKVTLTLAQPGLVTTDMLDTALTTYIKNTDNATETTNGISKIATQPEVDTGVEDTKIVTSKKLKARLDSLLAGITTNFVKLTQLATETVAGITKIATQTEVNAGVDDTKIVTSKKLKALFGGSNVNFGVNGYEKLPSGIIIQWGWSAIPPIQNGIVSFVEQSINFPITFPNSCLSVNFTGTADIGDDGLEALHSVIYRDKNKVIIRSYRMVGSYSGVPGSVSWQAIGY